MLGWEIPSPLEENPTHTYVLEAKQSSQMASGAPLVAAKCPFLVPLRAVHPASLKEAISGQILSLHRYRCWPIRLCHPNGPGLGRVWITLAPMYLQGLRNPFISWLSFGMCLAFTFSIENDTKLMALKIIALLVQDNSRFYVSLVVSFKR